MIHPIGGCHRFAASLPWVKVGPHEEEDVNIIDLGSSALNLANTVTSLAANVTYLLQAWGLL
ncbi:hypothetical protein FMUBM48_44850 [Nocardia cyriacigeorgica]|nr:hypothetical protein FMUBM48_44850 [Nocardia cyriacigeorgica]